MYRFIRTARIKDGKGVEARKWAKAVINHVNEKHPGFAWEACMEVFGAVNTLHFLCTFAELGDWDLSMARLQADEAYQAMSEKHVQYYIDGSMQDTLMRLL